MRKGNSQCNSLPEDACKNFPYEIRAFCNQDSGPHPTLVRGIDLAISPISKKKPYPSLLAFIAPLSCLHALTLENSHLMSLVKTHICHASAPGLERDVSTSCLPLSLVPEDGNCDSTTCLGSLTVRTHQLLLKGEGHS